MPLWKKSLQWNKLFIYILFYKAISYEIIID